MIMGDVIVALRDATSIMIQRKTSGFEVEKHQARGTMLVFLDVA